MPIPNFAGKHGLDSLFTPQEFRAYVRDHYGVPDVPLPERIVLLYQSDLLQMLVEEGRVERAGVFPGTVHRLKGSDEVGVVGGFGIGAPALAATVEDLIAGGSRVFISAGTAGALQPGSAIGDVVVCDDAIRDEGVSHHYLDGEARALPDADLTSRLAEALSSAGDPPAVGSTWTIDAPYRETVAEARHYQAEGVQTVDMEAAALFAVAEYRGVRAAAVFSISDSLAELTWTPRFGSTETKTGLRRAFDAAVDVLRSL